MDLGDEKVSLGVRFQAGHVMTASTWTKLVAVLPQLREMHHVRTGYGSEKRARKLANRHGRTEQGIYGAPLDIQPVNELFMFFYEIVDASTI
jgi:hypothetical protein